MTTRAGWILLLGTSLLYNGCSSPATHFYSLSPERPAEATPTSTATIVQIQAVHVPETLDRPELVTQSSPVRLEIHDFERWAAPFPDLVRGVLSQDLAGRLAPGRVLPPLAPTPPGTRGIVVDIQNFEPGSDGHVRLQASWTLTSDGPPVPGGSLQLKDPATSADADAQVTAMNRLLGQLSDALAAWLIAAAR